MEHVNYLGTDILKHDNYIETLYVMKNDVYLVTTG